MCLDHDNHCNMSDWNATFDTHDHPSEGVSKHCLVPRLTEFHSLAGQRSVSLVTNIFDITRHLMTSQWDKQKVLKLGVVI